MTENVSCPHCGDQARQVKTGTHGGSVRYKCMLCRRKYVPKSGRQARLANLQAQAAQLRASRMTQNQIAEHLGVHPRTVARWLSSVRDTKADGDKFDSLDAPISETTEPVVKRRATVEDVARAAGVSISTVSNVINDTGRMGHETKDRVRQAMDELNFSPNALIRSLRKGRTGILGVFCFGMTDFDTDMGDRVAPPLLAGMNAEAVIRERNLLMYSGWEDHWRRSTWRPFLDGHIDGLIWVAPGLSDASLERVAAAGLPVVALLSRHVPSSVGYVNADNIGGVESAVAHLRDLGHVRIGFVGPVYNSNYFDRLEGYRTSITSAGLPLDPALEATNSPADWDNESHVDEVMRWFDLPDPPTAAVVLDDPRAMRLVKELTERGVKVPEDIAVVGFDDLPNTASVCGGITSVRQDFRRIGSLGVDRLLAMIDGAPVEECQITVPATLVIRRSTVG